MPVDRLVRATLAVLLLPAGVAQVGATPYDLVEAAMVDVMNEYRLPSLSLAIGKDDAVAFAMALGDADVAAGIAATTDTQYSVASLAKPMTAAALGTLVDTGAVDLDATVARYLDHPGFTARFTVRELASHLAGIPHDTPERLDAEFRRVRDHQNPLDALYVFEAHDLLFDPGTDVHYSSNGYILLSALIEEVSPTGFVDYLDSAVWTPLGLEHTELDASVAGELEARYYARIDDRGDYVEATAVRDRSFLFGGGGFLSTPSDMVRLARATYDDDFLKAGTRRAFHEVVRLRNGEENPDGFSVGWKVSRTRLAGDREWIALEHAGLMEGAATAYLLVIPECRQSIAFATNTVPDGFWRMYAAIAQLLKNTIEESRCRPFH
jgi:CubicO group peptidase (beta-lactamase class C family)